MSKTRSTILYVLLATFALIGVLGETAKLHNSLVNSYPYKMMGTPPAEFYASIGQHGYYIAVVLGIATILLTVGLPRYLTSLIPVAVAPAAYWVVFEMAHVLKGFGQDEMTVRNFEGYTGQTAKYEFAIEALTLLVVGLAIGGLLGVVGTKLFAIRNAKFS